MNIKKPNFILRVRGTKFSNGELSCLGSQLSVILESLEEYTKEHNWYIFDVLGSSQCSFDELFPLDAENKTMVTSTNRLIDKVKEVIQFESGVFIAIRKDKKINWETDFLPVTEEDEGLQHPLADIEIRAFDYSYFEIFGVDFEVEKKILKHLE